jgi:hypothetical protein
MIKNLNYFTNGVKDIYKDLAPMSLKLRLFKQYGMLRQEIHRLNQKEHF